MRHITRPFWVLLALLFLLEAWLWDHLEPIAEWIVARIPLKRLKEAARSWIEHLHPAATLVVFAVPGIVLFPVKLLSVWLLAKGYWFGSVAVFTLSKCVGLGFSAFIFEVTRPKLLQMAWFRTVHDTVLAWRDWAREQVRPLQRRIRALIYLSRPRRAGKLIRRLIRIRRKMHGPEPAT
jgi:hypothetical protein